MIKKCLKSVLIILEKRENRDLLLENIFNFLNVYIYIILYFFLTITFILNLCFEVK